MQRKRKETEEVITMNGDTIIDTCNEPLDVIVEKINDEFILAIDRGYPSERSFTFGSIFIDVFKKDDIMLGVSDPKQFMVFDDVKKITVEQIEGSGIGAIEIYC